MCDAVSVYMKKNLSEDRKNSVLSLNRLSLIWNSLCHSNGWLHLGHQQVWGFQCIHWTQQAIMLNKCNLSASPVLRWDVFGNFWIALSDSALTLAHLLLCPGLEGYWMLHMLLASGCGQNVLGVRWMLWWTVRVDIWPQLKPTVYVCSTLCHPSISWRIVGHGGFAAGKWRLNIARGRSC